MFGRKSQTTSVAHVMGIASSFGGLPYRLGVAQFKRLKEPNNNGEKVKFLFLPISLFLSSDINKLLIYKLIYLTVRSAVKLDKGLSATAAGEQEESMTIVLFDCSRPT